MDEKSAKKPELAQPLMKLLDAGYEPIFITPEANAPQMDPMSNSAIWFLDNWAEQNCELDLIKNLELDLKNPRSISSITNDELPSFSGILIPGGHSPKEDLGSNSELGHVLSHFHSTGNATGVICHGPIALVSTQLSDGEFIYKGCRLTCYANKEASNEMMSGAKLIRKVEDVLREAGANVEIATIPLTPKGRELVTGEGPSSDWPFVEEFVKLLEEQSTTPKAK
ncbi:class I glutamine amidotransferase-like protein [Cyathus striatus]|nr:class I glutamine amidotransferase-like protein [Cyathus striatus]